MASLSDARFSLPDPNVVIPQVQSGIKTSTASAIKAFGQIGGEARKGFLEGALLNDLQETGDIINTINQGDEAIRGAVKEGTIDPTSKRFQSLAAATQQGKISQQRASLEAEVLLRESISKAPGFADHFRQTAKEVLGFDASSASLNSLFLSGPDTAKTAPLTQEQKDMQQAEAMFKGGAVDSAEQGFRLIQQDRANQLRENVQASAIADGRVQAGKIAVEGANRVSDRLNQVMVGAMHQIETAGGVDDIEAFRGAVFSVRDQVKSKIENEMANSQTHVYSPEEYNQVRARVDQQAESYIQLLENQDLTAILSKNRTRLADLVEIAGVQLAPDLAVLAPFGETVVRSYMDMMTISGGDPRKMEELMKADPTKAFVGGLVLDAASISKGLKATADGSVGSLLESGTADPDTVKAVLVDQANGVAAGKDSDIPIGKLIQGLSDADMPKTAVSLVAKAPRAAFTEQSEQERQVTVQNFTRTQDQQVQSLQSALAANDEFQLGHDGTDFVVVDRQGRSLQELEPFAPQTFANEEAQRTFTNQARARSAGVTDALNYINSTLTPVMSDTRWAAQLGHDDGNAWASNLINTVNLGALANDVGDINNPVLSNLGLREQGALRSAFRAGDVDRAMEILAGIQDTGLNQQVAGVSSGTDLTGVSQNLRTNLDTVQYQGNPIVPGLTREVQNVAQFEGIHDPADETWDGKTVGYGLDLDTNPRAADILEQHGLTGKTRKQQAEYFRDNPAEAAAVLQQEVAAHKAELIEAIPEVEKLGEVQQEVMANLAYNMGVTNIKGFTEMVKAIKKTDPAGIQKELLTTTGKDGTVRLTKWVSDVGAKRAGTLAWAIANDAWPTDEQAEQAADMLRERGA